ncbi:MULTISPECIES: zinc ribbon domain-containing protein [Muribaculaceae]|uniref:zinc ribbon domain-containing protein n=1 Tax=Muribaculaceae TaxID=2005473 RepID=UPI002585D3C6|nr:MULTISPECIES: zinc ribbon domain-containing protein [Muribaculaceae]
MFSHLLISIILTLGVVIIGYRYLINNYLKQHPSVNADSIKAALKLPVLQFGVWTLAFIPFWAFLPTHPQKDGGEAFLSSDLANWAMFRELANLGDGLYLLQTLLGLGFLIFGGIGISVIYSLIKQKIYSDSTIKALSTLTTVFTTLVAWNILVTIVGCFVILLLGDSAPAIFLTIFILANIVLAWWIIRKAIRMQKSFNASFPTLSHSTIHESKEDTKKCPYCGETILSVAKKCKHCGEWIKEEDTIIEIKKKICPICGEEINAEDKICPYCHENVEQPRNAFREKIMAEKENAKSKDNIKTNNKTWIIVAIVAVAIVICAVIFSSKNSSLSSSQSNKTIDTYKEVEITPEEDYDDYYNSDGMIQHSEDQGQNIPGDDDPWNN